MAEAIRLMNFPIKLLHIFPTFGLGGQQRRLADLIAGLGPAYEHHIISLSSDIEAGELLPPKFGANIQIIKIQKSAYPDPSNIKQFRTLIKQCAPNVLCTYNWGSIEAAMALKMMGGAKSVAHIHFEDGFGPDENPTKQNWRRVFVRQLVLKNSILVVPSVTLEALALGRWKLSPLRVQRISNGIESKRFYIKNRVVDHTGPVTIGTVGAFRPEKNLVRLISLFDAHSAERHARLVLVGDGPQRERLESKARNSARVANIEFPGPTRNPERAYEDFDIFSLTSDTEQMPISLMEAMMAGLPVVATNVGDIAAMVSDENRPFICSPKDEALLLESMERMIDDASLRERVGRANQEKAIQHFDRKRMIDRYDALFKGVLR